MDFRKFEITNDSVLCVYLKLYKESIYIGQIFYFKINDSFHIGNLNIRKDYRGKGYGCQLLQRCLEDIKNNYKINIVKLTDISDRCKKPNNIYIKFGFVYESEQQFESNMILLMEP
jgi:predicted GNAT family N-acyltransferase